MERLFSEDTELQKLIEQCHIRTIDVSENLAPTIAKQSISRFLHPTSRYEVAVITDYEKTDGTKSRIVSRLRIGTTVHDLEIPS